MAVTTRDVLLQRLQQVGEQVAAMEQQVDAMIEASRGDNADDEHDPEGATIAFERQQLMSLLGRQRQVRADVERALAEVDAGTYGQCEGCGGPIAPERLEARPDARLCIACARLT